MEEIESADATLENNEKPKMIWSCAVTKPFHSNKHFSRNTLINMVQTTNSEVALTLREENCQTLPDPSQCFYQMGKPPSMCTWSSWRAYLLELDMQERPELAHIKAAELKIRKIQLEKR